MYSINFPEMVSNTNAKLIEGYDATYNNLYLLLKSQKTSLFGDPYFGTNLKRLFFEQNNNILKDIVIDDIYTAILTFLPQLSLKRRDIEIVNNRETVYINIKATNLLDFQTNLYTINLTDFEENE